MPIASPENANAKMDGLQGPEQRGGGREVNTAAAVGAQTPPKKAPARRRGGEAPARSASVLPRPSPASQLRGN